MKHSHQDLASVTAPPITRYALLGGVLLVLLFCFGLMWLNPNRTFPLLTSRSIASSQPTLPERVSSSTNTQSANLYLLLPGTGNSPDIYSFNPLSNTAPINLSSSAGITETMPILSRDGSMLAYYGIYSDGTTDLFIWQIPNGRGVPLTAYTGSTKLHNGFVIELRQHPVWSPDGIWIAFLAKQTDGKGNATELYLARTTSPELIALTASGTVISNPVWMSVDEIAYVEQQGDGKSIIQRRKITPNAQPTPIATLQPFR